MILRLCLGKGDKIRFISHLDLMNTLIRALRRAQIPLAYTKGYNPRPKLAMGPPLPVGLTSKAEYVDLQVQEIIAPINFSRQFQKELPQDLSLKKVGIQGKGPSLMALLDTACYQIPFKTSLQKEEQREAFELSFKEGDLLLLREKKGKKRLVDLRPLIRDYQLVPREGILLVKIYVTTGSKGNVKPLELLEILTQVVKGLIKPPLTEIVREGLYYEQEGSFLPPL